MVESASDGVAGQRLRRASDVRRRTRPGSRTMPGTHTAGSQRLHLSLSGPPLSDRPRQHSRWIARAGGADRAAFGRIIARRLPRPRPAGGGLSTVASTGPAASPQTAPRDAELTHLRLGTNVRSNERYPALASHRSGRLIHAVRRANSARRSSRLLYPKTAAPRLHPSRSVRKNQSPQNGHLVARFDWGLGAICFGASPVAAVFGSAPGSATSLQHRIYLKPTPQTHPVKADSSTWQRLGHFYLALTGGVE